MRKKSKSISSRQLKNDLRKFKKIVEQKLGKVDWRKVSKVAFVLLLLAATKGLLGPKAKFIAGNALLLAKLIA